MEKKSLLKLSLLSLATLTACSIQNDKNQDNTPNILFFLADDMGYRDPGCYGSRINTPIMDSLAEKGIKFTNFYAAAPNCSPSRAAVLTGRFPSRVGMYSYRPGGGHPMHLKDEEVTIAELLKENNYQTAHFGKWHLSIIPYDSAHPQPQPSDQGFDYSLGTKNNAKPSHKDPVNFVRNGKEIGKVDGYACQIVADEVIHWFDEHYDDSKPFFHCVWFHEPHKVVASPPELIANYPDASPEDAEYFANVENMDIAAGRILEEIRKRDLESETIIIFSSDNGPYRRGSQGELRGLKGEVLEGGIRVPGIFYWKDHFEGGRIIDEPAGLVDILPTILDICNFEQPEERVIDGTSILPLFEGKEIHRETPLFWYFYRSWPEAAIRMGDYNMLGYSEDTIPRMHSFFDKDMEFIKNSSLVDFELYNLVKDPAQQNNLYQQRPELADSIREIFLKTYHNVIEEAPYWEGLWEYDPKKARKKQEYAR